MDESIEISYMLGHRLAWLGMLQECIRRLGYDDTNCKKANWIAEREEAIAALRNVCEYYGDTDWPNDFRLADIIDKHLLRHLATKD